MDERILQRFQSQAPSEEAESQDQPEPKASRQLQRSLSESNLPLLSPIQDEDEEGSLGKRKSRSKSKKRKSRSKSVQPHSSVFSGWLPALDFTDHVKPPLYHRLSSHPIDKDFLHKRLIEQYHRPRQLPEVSLAEFGQAKHMLKRTTKRLYTLNKKRRQEWDEEAKQEFFFVANQCFLYGINLTLCALCTHSKCKLAGGCNKLLCNCDQAKCTESRLCIDCNKGNHANHRKCHIFPSSLLESYGKIHCSKQVNFIYDPSSRKMKGVGTLAFRLFCKDCEERAQNEEEILRNVYLKIMAVNGKSCHLKVSESLSHKLRHILAVILFRGTLMGVHFWKQLMRISYQKFFEVFLELRNYCFESEMETYSKMPFADKIYLFLLPNAPFNPQNEQPTYIIDYQLRNPQFTTVIKVGKNLSSCFYMKFDCFHCVVPIVDNGDLGFLSTTGSCFAAQTYKKSFILLDHKDAINSFPRELLDYNLTQVEQLLHQILHIPKAIKEQPYCILRWHLMYPEEMVSQVKPKIDNCEDITECKLEKADIEKLQETASTASPLSKGATVTDELMKHAPPGEEKAVTILALIQENEKQKKEIQDLKEQLQSALKLPLQATT